VVQSINIKLLIITTTYLHHTLHNDLFTTDFQITLHWSWVSHFTWAQITIRH